MGGFGVRPFGALFGVFRATSRTGDADGLEISGAMSLARGEGKTGGLECDMSGKRTRPWCVVEVESWRHGVSNDGYYQSYSGWW